MDYNVQPKIGFLKNVRAYPVNPDNNVRAYPVKPDNSSRAYPVEPDNSSRAYPVEPDNDRTWNHLETFCCEEEVS